MDALLAHVRHQTLLDIEDQPGSSRRKRLEHAEKVTGETPDALLGPECPPELEHIAEWANRIAPGRAGGGMTIAPITWQDLVAWMQFTGLEVDEWEAHAIFSVDAARREIWAKFSKAKPQPR